MGQHGTASAYSRVLVGTDGSATAAHAVRAAAAMAQGAGVPLLIATAWYRNNPDPGPAAVQVTSGRTNSAAEANAWATQVVSDAAGVVRAAGYDNVEVATPIGNPADVLVRLAAEQPGTLTVVGTVGLDSTAERLVGNVPHSLTHHCPGDLLLVRSDDRQRDTWNGVAVATDGSPTAAIAVARGVALANAIGAPATLLTIARDQAQGDAVLAGVAEGHPELAELDRQVVIAKDPSRGLVDAGSGFDLLVVGNKGMSGPSRLLGSVSNRLTHAVPTDILLVNTTR